MECDIKLNATTQRFLSVLFGVKTDILLKLYAS